MNASLKVWNTEANTAIRDNVVQQLVEAASKEGYVYVNLMKVAMKLYYKYEGADKPEFDARVHILISDHILRDLKDNNVQHFHVSAQQDILVKTPDFIYREDLEVDVDSLFK